MDKGQIWEVKVQIEKEKRKISITCQDGSSIKGFIHLIQGQRTSDFFNDPKDDFIILTEAELYYVEDVHSFKLASRLVARREAILLSKKYIKWVEEASS